MREKILSNRLVWRTEDALPGIGHARIVEYRAGSNQRLVHRDLLASPQCRAGLKGNCTPLPGIVQHLYQFDLCNALFGEEKRRMARGFECASGHSMGTSSVNTFGLARNGNPLLHSSNLDVETSKNFEQTA